MSEPEKKLLPITSTIELVGEKLDQWNSANKSVLKMRAGWEFIHNSLKFFEAKDVVASEDWMQRIQLIKRKKYFLGVHDYRKNEIMQEIIELEEEFIGELIAVWHELGYISETKVQVLAMHSKALYSKALPTKDKREKND